MRLENCYPRIIADENLWLAWTRFRSGKGRRGEVRCFEENLEANLLEIRSVLTDRSYVHGAYRSFVVHDPKRRLIHVPSVRDQVVHQAAWNVLFPFFNARFSPSATSCRPGMGTSAARAVIRRWGKDMETRYVLHMDVVKCFDSISHGRLAERLGSWIDCADTLGLLGKVIESYSVNGSPLLPQGGAGGGPRGIPLGNLTSQLFCNLAFMDFDRQLDQSVGIGNWIRYADDTFVRGSDRVSLGGIAASAEASLAAEGLRCRSEIRPYHGFEALGSRWFIGGSESVARSTRARSLRLAGWRSTQCARGEVSQNGLRATFDSLRGLAPDDSRWTKRVRDAIMVGI